MATEHEVEFLARSVWESEDYGIRWDDAPVEERELYRRIATRTLDVYRAQAEAQAEQR